MNLFELLTGILPVSSAVLSVVASIATAILTKKITSVNDKKTEKLEIKINGKKINIEGYDEKEVIELLEKLSAEKKEEMPDSKKTN